MSPSDDVAQVSELVDVLESMIVDHNNAVSGCCVRLLCQVAVSGCCVRLLFVNTFVCFALTERPM